MNFTLFLVFVVIFVMICSVDKYDEIPLFFKLLGAGLTIGVLYLIYSVCVWIGGY